jgi:hypothetical protein
MLVIHVTKTSGSFPGIVLLTTDAINCYYYYYLPLLRLLLVLSVYTTFPYLASYTKYYVHSTCLLSL